MKKFCLSVLFSVLCLTAVAATWQEAEQAYRESRFAFALAAYEDLLRSFPNDPHLYYNIGNCYFKMGSKGLAIANYYRAFRLAPRDSDIRHNLSLALAESGERLVAQGVPEILHTAFFWCTYAELKGLLYIAWWLFCLVSIMWLFRRKYGKIVLVVAVLLTLIATWYALRYSTDHASIAVVAAPMAELRSGPGTNFPASANIAQGHILLLQDSRDNWREVIVKSQGIKGWMDNAYLEKI